MRLAHIGWIRLATALSVVWITLVAGYLVYEWNEPFYQKHVFFTHFPDPSGTHAGTNEDPIPVQTPFTFASFLKITFIPISIVWVITFIVVPAVRWISEGFKKANET